MIQRRVLTSTRTENLRTGEWSFACRENDVRDDDVRDDDVRENDAQVARAISRHQNCSTLSLALRTLDRFLPMNVDAIALIGISAFSMSTPLNARLFPQQESVCGCFGEIGADLPPDLRGRQSKEFPF